MPDTITFFQQGLWLSVIMSGPPLIVATVVGLIVSIVQAVTQIQDQTFPFAVKVVAIAMTLAFLGRWFGSEILQLTNLALAMVPNIGR